MSKRFALILLFILSVIPLLDLLHPGLPITHDGQDHVARIANFYQSLSEGNIIPRWAGNLNWGFGHPILMFLYPLPSYIASFFHFIGFSFVDSTKLVFAIGYIASVFSMFIWISAQSGIFAGFVAGMLYGFAPYHFIDLYVRGAIGEHVAFVWPPIICFGLLQLARQKKFSGVIIAIGISGLILSHNAVSLMFLPILFFYVLYLYYFETKRNMLFVFYSFWFLILGFVLSSFFWIPAFFEGKYTLRDIVTKGDLTDRFVPIQMFFYSSWNYGGGNQFSKALGFIQWLVIGGSVCIFGKSKNIKVKWFLGISLLIFVASIFLMTPSSAVLWQNISLLQKFQFPWRLLTVSAFVGSVIGAIVASNIPRKFFVTSVLLFIIVIYISTYQMWHSQSYSAKSEEFYPGVYNSTTDTGESSPIWSTRFMERRAVAPMEVITGEAVITPKTRKSTLHEYEILSEIKTRLVENTLYFPGWNIYVDGKRVEVEFQDPDFRGLMTFWVDKGEHVIVVRFGDTKLRMIANALTGFGIVILLVSLLLTNKQHET